MSQPRGNKPAPPPALLSKPGVVQGKRAEPPGASPIGWTFYSTFKRCERMTFLRYVLQMYPREVSEALATGTCFHALMEGKSEEEITSWGPEFVRALPLARKLHKARMTGPKMGKVASVEETLTVKGPLHNLFTSKPDRIEEDEDAKRMYPINGEKRVKNDAPQRIVREFKTAQTFRDTDDERWQVNGEVIGELVASGLKEAVVDITGKFEQPVTRQIQVLLTEKKQARWESLIIDTINQVRRKLDELHTQLKLSGPSPSFLEDSPIPDKYFPANLDNCVSFSGTKCDYYTLCWGEKTTLNRHLFIKKNGKLDWAKRLDVEPLVREILKFDLRKK